MHSRFHDNLGHSIADPATRRAWIDMLSETMTFVVERNLGEEILFHGTTEAKARAILKQGMRATDAFEVLPDGDEGITSGSFWGTLRTAAWYAEDTAIQRSGGGPAIIACPISFLQAYSTLGIDIPSRDLPQPGLTKLDDPAVAARWRVGEERSWQDSLADLGSVTALHDYMLPLDQAVLLEGIESLGRILPTSIFSA